MKKHICIFLTAITVICTVFSASFQTFADDGDNIFTCGDYKYSILQNGNAKIIGYCAYAEKELTIPSSLDGKAVEEVSLCPDTSKSITNSVETITIQNGILRISDKAFAYMKSLQSVTIPDSVKEIGEKAFSGCGKLKHISIGNGLERIKEFAFWNTAFIKANINERTLYIGRYLIYTDYDIEGTLKIRSGTKIAADDAIFSRKKLEEAIVPDSIINYPVFAFCYSLKKVNIPKHIDKLPPACFGECYKLEGIELPQGLTYIPRACFKDCISLKEVKLPSGVRKLYESSFRGCRSLERITLPKKVTLIGKNAFRSCKALKQIKLGKKVKTIGTRAFQSTALREVSLPDSVRSINYRAFYRCKKLKSINVSKQNTNFYIKNDALYRTKNNTKVWERYKEAVD